MDEWNKQPTNERQSGEYHYPHQQIQQDQPAPSSVPNPYINSAPAPKKPKRPKKFGLGAVITSALCAAVFSSVLSTVGVMAYLNPNQSTGGTSSETASQDSGSQIQHITNITVNDQTDNIAIAAAQKASPSVVGIRVTYLTQSQGIFGSSTQEAVGEGSGVIYRNDGYIITNYHVIAEAVADTGYGSLAKGAKIEVFLESDLENAILASVVGYDASADLAVIKIDRNNLPAIEIGDSSKLKIGQVAIAIGNPGGLEYMGSVSKGIVSGLNRSIVTEDNVQMNLIQTDASINPGNSGGALVDQTGKLIGINNAKMSGTNYDGMGFSIPVNEVVEICDRMISKEGQPTVMLGISINTYYTASRLQSMGYPAGIVVASVADGYPAKLAGIRANDVITQINEKNVTTYAAMLSEVNKYNVGDQITVTVYRNRQTIKLTVVFSDPNQ